MKSLVIVQSYRHMNTEKIARAVAEALGAETRRPQGIRPEAVRNFDLIGFGAGIAGGRHYKPLLDFAAELPDAAGQRAFIFSTAGIAGERATARNHKALREILLSKGYAAAGEFCCKGFNTNSVLKLFGGMNKGRPDGGDLDAAAAFARKLKDE
ncbi:MAG: flavodoxin [Clostridiales bacterium]|jgi:flavodoxin|nr:flavodoxin [Clostridiales bacterium]